MSGVWAIFAYAALSVGLCSAAAAQAVVIGAKEFTEQLLVAEMTAQLLRASGLSPHKGTGFATTGVRTLQERGIVDVYWEYTGTSLITFNHVTEKLSADEAYERVRTLDAERGLVWLAPSKVDNTYALAMRGADAARKGISSISDLATKVRAGDGHILASTAEFVTRADGLKPLEQAYGFQFGWGKVVTMDPAAIYTVLHRSSELDVGRKTTLERFPQIKAPLEKLSGQLNNDTMAALNAAVDLQGRKVEDVASDFLRSRALLSGP